MALHRSGTRNKVGNAWLNLLSIVLLSGLERGSTMLGAFLRVHNVDATPQQHASGSRTVP